MGFVKARNVALGVYFAEFVCCLFRLGLYSVRRFVISIIINVVFLILTVIGGYGTLIINPYFVIIHWGGVLIAYVIFLIMILATLGTGSGDGNGEIFAYYIPLLIEPIPLALLLYFNWIICRFQINYEKLEKVRIEAEREDIINGMNRQENNIPRAVAEDYNSLEINGFIPAGVSENERKQENKNNSVSVHPSANLNKYKNTENTDSEKLCCICYEKQYNNVFIPCGHFCCCTACAKRVFSQDHRCPICKKNIDKLQVIYEA